MFSEPHLATALQRLRHDLGDRAFLLQYLPDGDKLRWEDQGEIPEAIPKAIFYGRKNLTRRATLDETPHFWIYLCRQSPTLVYFSYYLDGTPDGQLVPDRVRSEAVPHDAFRFATTPLRQHVLALYYYVRAGAGAETSYHIILPKEYHDTLLSICKDIRNEEEVSLEGQRLSKLVKLRVRVPSTMFIPPGERFDEQDQQQVYHATANDDETDSRKNQDLADAHIPEENEPGYRVVSSFVLSSPSLH
jgi:hypothetical protein